MKRKIIFATLLTGILFFTTSCSNDDDSVEFIPEANRIETVSGANQAGIIETELSNPIEVMIKDQNGNAFTGANVDFSVTDGNLSSITATSDGSGMAITYWTLGSIIGVQQLTATVFQEDGVTPLSGSPLIISATATDIPCQTLLNSTVLPVGPSAGTLTTSVISISDSFTVSDVNVTLNINHTWVADMDIFLIAPDGTMVELTTDNGGPGDNFVNTVFDDEATLLIIDVLIADAPFTNTYQPEGSLADFNGLQANGDWTLSITDDQGSDGGSLINWFIDICGY
ncbi:proprotein convertase P-domain-containing protein [Bizionia arctica]|uniref:P/Homo B domain-containing protein n=1 Tax=Bizionia arctica TaxID=1495645 RepID=A0A917LN43_9FLAO|nr:proprotein convertase P-domain-containing protein [Bizionia arctica]GGG44444.1 hypothetical protein GCM10010976_15040 [Bizionia arctica]